MSAKFAEVMKLHTEIPEEFNIADSDGTNELSLSEFDTIYAQDPSRFGGASLQEAYAFYDLNSDQ